jgi:hypothetical protein
MLQTVSRKTGYWQTAGEQRHIKTVSLHGVGDATCPRNVTDAEQMLDVK